jgi:hypothetical protein
MAMRTILHRALALGALALSLACASASSSTRRPSGSRSDLIGAEELSKAQWPNAWELVSNLRPQWLTQRGTDSFNNPSVIQVIVDDVRLGPVTSLRNLPTSGITSLQWVDALSATARWGLDFGSGAIYISTRR